MSALDVIRHQAVFNPVTYCKIPIHVIGAGATGSKVFASLVELGLTNITLYDDDIVEKHNLANQLYLTRDIGLPKVEAAKQWAMDKLGVKELPSTMRFVAQKVPFAGLEMSGIVFLMTDTMVSRRQIMKFIIETNEGLVSQIIETRMASSYGNVFAFPPLDAKMVKAWEATLIDDKEAEVSACGTSISVGPTANIIANMAVWKMMVGLLDPEAMDNRTNIFLKPFVTHSEAFHA